MLLERTAANARLLDRQFSELSAMLFPQGELTNPAAGTEIASHQTSLNKLANLFHARQAA